MLIGTLSVWLSAEYHTDRTWKEWTRGNFDYFRHTQGYHTDRTQEKHYKVTALPWITNTKVTSRAAPFAAKKSFHLAQLSAKWKWCFSIWWKGEICVNVIRVFDGYHVFFDLPCDVLVPEVSCHWWGLTCRSEVWLIIGTVSQCCFRACNKMVFRGLNNKIEVKKVPPAPSPNTNLV